MNVDRRSLLAHFQEEAEEHLDALAKALLSLEARPDDDALVEDMLRHAHSLKGAAKLAGGTGLERLTHALETLLSDIRGRRLIPTRGTVNAMLSGVDAMKDALERLMGGITDGGSEAIISDLLSLAASSVGLDERLRALLPGLDPEIREVLTEFQKSQLVLACDVGKACWAVELAAPDERFAARIDEVYERLKTLGEVVSLAGLSPSATGELRFTFVIATRQTEAQVSAAARDLSVSISNPTMERAAADIATEPTPEETAFAEEMAKLVVQYVVEAADEVREGASLVLALETHPDDAAILNALFRFAHSLKGSGMTYGLPAVSDVAHHMETVLEAVRTRRIGATTRVTDALLAGVDALKDILAQSRDGAAVAAAPEAVLRTLDDAASGASVEAVSAPEPAATPRTVRSAGDTIRVRLGKLDQLVNLAGELTISSNTRTATVEAIEQQVDSAKTALRQWQSIRERLQLDPAAVAHLRERGLLDEYDALGRRLADLRGGLDGVWNRFSATTSQADATTESLQQAVMQIRMVPVGSLFDTAPRMMRDLTADRTKAVNLVVAGEDTELDKRVLEFMADPLMHLLRNAVDHGIEPAEERARVGKPRAGAISLSAEHRGGHIVISVTDDGRGLDPARLTASAVAKGVIAEADAARMTREQAYALIFAPGFSTKTTVTAISGRGVGMDVVKANIDSLKGRIEIESEVGRGTTFRIHLPLSISLIQVVLLEVAGRSFCMPTTGVVEIIRVTDEAVQHVDGKPCILHRGRTIPIARLADLLEIGDHRPLAQSAVAVVQGIEGTIGFVVDRALAEQTVLVKELGRLLRRVPHVSGGTILSDGRVSVVLDVVSLVHAAIKRGDAWVDQRPVAATVVAGRTVLVVDDSLTTRELLRGLLETAGYTVVVARHGREAWDTLQSTRSLDLVVSDVNMPEMDGYELTKRIKADARLSGTPVVLVTSLAKPEEKLKGMQAGADAYIVKGAFDQTGLLARVQELVGTP